MGGWGVSSTTAEKAYFIKLKKIVGILALLSLVTLFIPSKTIYASNTKKLIFSTDDQPKLVYSVAVPKPVTKAVVAPKIKAYNPCSCVSYAKWLSGINVGIIGMAKNHPINSQTPQIGSLVVFAGNSKSPAGHLAVVIAINGNQLTIKESNWIHCQQGQRVIPSDEPDIKGFYV